MLFSLNVTHIYNIVTNLTQYADHFIYVTIEKYFYI